jgi:hypothetical protein
MELDAIEKRKGTKKRNNKKGNTKGGKDERTYYAYGKPGHFIKDCTSKNKVQRGQHNSTEKKTKPKEKEVLVDEANVIEIREFNIIKAGPSEDSNKGKHNALHWSQCYNNSCEAHREIKIAS